MIYEVEILEEIARQITRIANSLEQLNKNYCKVIPIVVNESERPNE